MSSVLEGEQILFAAEQFDRQALELLTAKATDLGAQVTTGRKDATIIITNPSSPSYAEEIKQIRFLAKSYPDLPQPSVRPYHWLSVCLLRGQCVAPEELPTPAPYFVHPDRSKDYCPLKAWVSVNVHREEGESPQEAQANISALLEEGGALAVLKRAHADLLVVDKQSRFYQTIKAEIAQYGRTWQKIAERDWVTDCVANGRLTWAVDRMEEEGGEEQDSFEEEEQVKPPGKGPGRPTGKVDYTAEDDDFLCRYLAAYHPNGSWGSRKTYSMLASKAAKYPIATRHSDQSWHERFKKNSAAMSKRIERFVREGVDETLKTRDERGKVREKEKEKAGARAAEAASKLGAAAAASIFAAGPSDSRAAVAPIQRTEASSSAGQTSSESYGRQLVTAESDEEGASAAKPKDKDRALAEPAYVEQSGVTRAYGKLAQSSAVSVREAAAIEPPQPILEAERAPANPSPEHLARAPDGTPGKPRSLAAEDSLEDRTEIEQALPMVDIVGESVKTQQSNGHNVPLTEVETQEILSDFMLARSAVRTEMPLSSEQLATPEFAQAGPSTTAQPPAVSQASLARRSRRYQTRGTERLLDIRPAEEAFRRIAVTPKGVTPDGREVTQTSPSRRRSALQAQLEESATKRAKRVSLGGASASRVRSPDKVAASATIPVPRHPSSSPSLGPTPTQAKAKAPAVTLTKEQHLASILRGQELVSQQRDLYRRKINELAGRYGLGPAELVKFVNELKLDRKGGGWEAVEAGLRQRFGR